MEKNNIIITALCIITTISLSSCIEDGDMEDFKEKWFCLVGGYLVNGIYLHMQLIMTPFMQKQKEKFV